MASSKKEYSGLLVWKFSDFSVDCLTADSGSTVFAFSDAEKKIILESRFLVVVDSSQLCRICFLERETLNRRHFV